MKVNKPWQGALFVFTTIYSQSYKQKNVHPNSEKNSTKIASAGMPGKKDFRSGRKKAREQRQVTPESLR